MADNKFAPRISPENTTPATSTVSAEVDAFLAKMRGISTQPAANGGRLIFALDATASRQRTWDCTCAGLYWDGRCSGWSEASALAS
jgi:hypothetical protein